MHAALDSDVALSWFSCAGLRIASTIPLDLVAAPAVPGVADVMVLPIDDESIEASMSVAKPVATVGDEPASWLEVYRVPNAYLLRWPDAVDVIVSDDGREMRVCQRGPLDDAIERLLLCHALSFVVLAHGREGLHASAVELDGRAVIVAGESGRGKSTLAAALCMVGGTLLADDLTVVGVDRVHGVVVYPSATSTWLAPAFADGLGVGDAALASQRTSKVAIRTAGSDRPVPVAAMFFARYHADVPRARSVIGPERVLSVLAASFNPIVRTSQRVASQFEIATRMVDQVSVQVVSWDPHPDTALSVARSIAAHVHDTAAGANEGAHMSIQHINDDEKTRGDSPAARREIIERLRAAGVQDLPDEDLDEPLLRTSQVAALLRSSDRTVRTWADAGKLKHIKTLGGRRLFPASAVLSVLQSMRGESKRDG